MDTGQTRFVSYRALVVVDRSSLSLNFLCVAEPNVELDVVEANRKFMETSEELYDALIDCHWHPAELSVEEDYVVSSFAESVYC